MRDKGLRIELGCDDGVVVGGWVGWWWLTYNGVAGDRIAKPAKGLPIAVVYAIVLYITVICRTSYGRGGEG